MGFADLSIMELAADYKVSPEEILRLCTKLGISYRSPATRLPLEDVKAVILALTAPLDDLGDAADKLNRLLAEPIKDPHPLLPKRATVYTQVMKSSQVNTFSPPSPQFWGNKNS